MKVSRTTLSVIAQQLVMTDLWQSDKRNQERQCRIPLRARFVFSHLISKHVRSPLHLSEQLDSELEACL